MRLVQRARPGELSLAPRPHQCAPDPLTACLPFSNTPAQQLSSAAAAVSFPGAVPGAAAPPKAGWRIVNVIEGSPLEAAAAVSFTDVIVGVNGVSVDAMIAKDREQFEDLPE